MNKIIEPVVINKKDYKDVLKYIEKYWKEITCYHPHDEFKHLGLPNKFISPNHTIYKDDQFYWDSYFVILGLVKCGRSEIAKGIVDNFIYLQKRFNIIPMRNRYYNLGSSQIPFLSSMAREIYSATGDLNWMKNAMKAAEYELKSYWMNKKLTLTAEQKSKIYDVNLKYAKMNQDARTNDADDKKAMHQELKANESEREAEFKTILTSDQLLAFQTAKQELKQKRAERKKRN